MMLDNPKSTVATPDQKTPTFRAQYISSAPLHLPLQYQYEGSSVDDFNMIIGPIFNGEFISVLAAAQF